MGVSLGRVILVNSIFRKNVTGTPGIAPVYAVFSPVRPAGPPAFQQPLVLRPSPHHYSLCFCSFHSPFFFPAHCSISAPFGARLVLRSPKGSAAFALTVLAKPPESLNLHRSFNLR
jgi:hypothetical protein